jgi:uncharacterized protein (TIGR00106 family)
MVIVEVSFVPLGVGVSLSKYVAEAWKLIEQSGLKHEYHSMGTNIEGDLDEIFALIRKCHERFFEMGAPRVSTSVKISERRDKPSGMRDKVESVQMILNPAQ